MVSLSHALIAICLVAAVRGQLQVNYIGAGISGATTAATCNRNQVAQALGSFFTQSSVGNVAGATMQITSTSIAGDCRGFGRFSNAAFPKFHQTGGKCEASPTAQDGCQRGMTQGIVLSTGDVTKMVAQPFDSFKKGDDFGAKGVADDNMQFNMTFIYSGEAAVQYDVVFASREMPEYGGSAYNDNYDVDYVGSAGGGSLFSETTSTINAITPSPLREGSGGKAAWSNVFINNFVMTAPSYVGDKSKDQYTGRQHFGFTGYTQQITKSATAAANVPQTLRLKVVDIGDGEYDSALFFAVNLQVNMVVETFSCQNTNTINALNSNLCVASDPVSGCGPGTFSITQQCVSSTRGVVPNTTPGCSCATLQGACTVQCASYFLQTTPWGACSVTCGAGTRTRSSSCMSLTPTGQLTSAPASNCAQLAQASTTEACTMGPCVSYQCVRAQTSTCGQQTCGFAGMQVSTATCMRYNGQIGVGGTAVTNIAGIAACAGCQSVTTACPALPPCITYQCVTGQTSACPFTCGAAGSRTTTRTCMAYSGGSTTGTAVTNMTGIAACAGCQSVVSACPALPPCYAYQCVYSAYGACSITCSSNGQQGVRTNTASCMRYDGTAGVGQGVAVAGTFCPSTTGIRGASGCAPQQQPCAVPACVTYQCVTGQTSACPFTCGAAGSRTTTRTCMAYSGGSTTGTAVTNMTGIAACAGCQSVVSACPALPPCIKYACQVGPLSGCSVTCGSGVQTRTTTCVATSYAAVGAAPTTAQVSLNLCQNCVASAPQPCTMCPNFVPPPVVVPPPPAPVIVANPCGNQATGTILPYTTNEVLAARLLGSGVTATASITGAPTAFGTFCGYYGLSHGIVVSTGEVAKLSTPYIPTGGQNGEDHAPTGSAAGDKAVLSIKFSTASSQTVSLRFIFASQEMPKYFGTKYNDDAQITLDGKNIAVLPNGQELTINNIGCAGSIDAACKTDSSKYIKEYKQNVPAAPGTPASMSGYLSVLTASGSVAAGEHTLEIHVEDIGDGRFNSAIFVEGNSVNIASRRSLRQEAREVESAQQTTDSSALLPVLAGFSGLIVLSALVATTWMVADARAKKAMRAELSLRASNDMGVQTE